MFRDFLKRLIPGGSAPSAKWPVPLQRYMAARAKPHKSAPLADVAFVVFDTETTGLDLSKNRLLSIAGIAMHGPEVDLGDTFDVMVVQPDVGGAEAAVVHGLISSDLTDGLPEDEAVARFLEFARDAVRRFTAANRVGGRDARVELNTPTLCCYW